MEKKGSVYVKAVECEIQPTDQVSKIKLIYDF